MTNKELNKDAYMKEREGKNKRIKKAYIRKTRNNKKRGWKSKVGDKDLKRRNGELDDRKAVKSIST